MTEPPRDPSVGLCSVCRHAVVQRSARGSAFWRCRRADADPAFLRYPPLPVNECTGFAARPKAAQPAEGAQGRRPRE